MALPFFWAVNLDSKLLKLLSFLEIFLRRHCCLRPPPACDAANAPHRSLGNRTRAHLDALLGSKHPAAVRVPVFIYCPVCACPLYMCGSRAPICLVLFPRAAVLCPLLLIWLHLCTSLPDCLLASNYQVLSPCCRS